MRNKRQGLFFVVATEVPTCSRHRDGDLVVCEDSGKSLGDAVLSIIEGSGDHDELALDDVRDLAEALAAGQLEDVRPRQPCYVPTLGPVPDPLPCSLGVPSRQANGQVLEGNGHRCFDESGAIL